MNVCINVLAINNKNICKLGETLATSFSFRMKNMKMELKLKPDSVDMYAFVCISDKRHLSR